MSLSDNYQEVGYYKFTETEKNNWISIEEVSVFKTEKSLQDNKSKEEIKKDENLKNNDKTEKLIKDNEKAYEPPNYLNQSKDIRNSTNIQQSYSSNNNSNTISSSHC